MPRYANGRIPGGQLIKIGSGTDVNGYWEHQISPATLRKWQIALDYARLKWGKVMRISTGWNCYRPFAIQTDARHRAEANGEPKSAAVAGWSSHGGTWTSWKHTGGRWVDAMAIDVVPQQLTWAQVDEAMRYAGFLVGAITKDIAGMDEPWHYIDLDPWAAVPSGGATGALASNESEEDEMYIANVKNGNFYLVIGTKAHALGAASGARDSGIPIINYVDDWAVSKLKTVVSGIA